MNDSERHVSASTLMSPSPNASPQASPRPSPRQHHRRETSVGSYKESLLDKPDNFEDSISRSSDSSQLADLSRSASHDSSKDRKQSHSSDRSKKKSSWYNVLYPTYKSRSEDFKRIFKDVPPEERLIVDYSCALQKDILVHGRLYVSQNYLCFYANIFRWETLVTLRWKDVTAITKEKTALVIPNAILVCTEGEKLFFTTFTARDKTYLMLFRVWQNALLDQQMSMQEMWQWVHTCYGDELGLTSDDEDYIPPVTEEDKVSGISARFSVDSFSEFVFPKDAYSSSITEAMEHLALEEPALQEETVEMPPVITVQMPSMIPENAEELHPSNSRILSAENLPTDMSDTSDSDGEKLPVKGEIPICTSSHDGRELKRVTLPIHIDQLFTLLFTSSKFLLDFHSLRRTTDIVLAPWQVNAETSMKQRNLTMTMALNQSVGPKTTQVSESQVMLPCSKPGHLYAIDVESTNAGIPYADSFYVTTHYCLSRVGENESCLAVYSQIKYKKSVWGLVKGFIEKNTWAGLEDHFVALIKALRAECDRSLSVKKKTRRRRRGTTVGPTLEETAPRIGRPVSRSRLNIENRNSSDSLSWFVLLILIFLVCLNALLYYKLWVLEEWTQNSSHSFTVMDLQVLSHPPKSHDEWLRLLQHQEALHNVEMQKWQKVLQAAIQLLRQTEESLSELQVSMNPLVSKKVLSMLKETFADKDGSKASEHQHQDM
ncbi:protein Aster-B isoform X2 [Anabrus simplex]|uniref:protein Aster-B isoform X2 n=1 Tax=Anabrus simplex TaxID=316456 RepID=UPI0034DDA7E2